ncbi:hypothetical protein [Serratia quinivorans]|uniref:hypothetical protein n=1 Tax=Serratia quinivorans TaxID=137545 RepID=UPI0021BDDEAA|nr:hypothetical protein [Serratia quinivorans]
MRIIANCETGVIVGGARPLDEKRKWYSLRKGKVPAANNKELLIYNSLAKFNLSSLKSQHDPLAPAGRIFVEVCC